MIIYFIENEKIYTYKLPSVPSGNYILHDYDQNGNKRSLINVEGTNGKWIIKENDDTTLYYQEYLFPHRMGCFQHPPERSDDCCKQHGGS